MTSKFEAALTRYHAPLIHDAAFNQAASHDPAAFVSLNPQPLPPGPDPGPDNIWHHDPAGFVSLNPQPLPPGGGETGLVHSTGLIDPGTHVALNPQPLPPGPDPEPDNIWHHEEVHQSLFGGEHTALDLGHLVHPVVDFHG